MNDQSQHITHYSAEDIRRYLSGNMSASEMHAMEKAALDDPFLADAIEGMEQAMQSYGDTPVNDNLQELRTAIAEKTNPGSGKVRVMVWWKMMAAAVAVIVAGLFLWNGIFRSEERSVAPIVAQKQELPAEAKQVPAPDSNNPAVASATTTDTAPSGTLAYEDNKDVSSANKAVTNEKFPSYFKTPRANKNADAGYRNNYSQESLAKVDQQQHRKAQASLYDNFNKSKTQNAANAIPLDTNIPAKVLPAGQFEQVVVARNDNRVQFNFSDTVGRPVRTEIVGALQGHVPGLQVSKDLSEKERKKLSNVIRGRVVDNTDKPIANAYLRMQDGNNDMSRTWFTDREGFFNIPARIQDTGAMQVSVAAVGYNTQQARLIPNISSNQVQLQPANVALSDIVVAGYGKKTGSISKKYRETDLLQQNAEPSYGWISYDNYLKQNNRIAQSDSSTVRGEVIVSFVVNRKGELSDFSISSGLTPEANQEAIRLVKDGPAWKIKRGRKATATVIVHF